MATATIPTSQARFYREFLMARDSFKPSDFGIDLAKADFIDRMVDEFGAYTKGQLTVDELCLRPREALRFCELVRQKYGYFDLPDDIILRSVMNRRKSPDG